MALSAGTRLGPYEILEPLGAGGMGEVYRARDTRLDRTVAVKVLPAELASDPQLRARFEREARAISALAHPNICTLYDVGEESGQTFLVMEHLVGQTLADRLKKGPLPLDQALEVGTQIADALAAAHKQGIVHRDLKPGNVMLTKGGARLLDFGLVRLIAHGEQPAVESLTSAPTEPEPLTGAGTVMGTLPYMAPEQVEGKPADARTDLWALGAILYEMVAGGRAFEASTPTSLAAAILEREPAPLAARQPLTPPSLERLVRRCLAKDPGERWDTAHDVTLRLREIAETDAESSRPRRAPRRALPWGLVGVLAAGLLAVLILWSPWRRSAPMHRVPTRFTMRLAEDQAFQTHGSSVALSPDGRQIAYVARLRGTDKLYLRSLDQLDSRVLPGTEGATDPFFSPNGKWVGFFSHGGGLSRVSVLGGAPEAICETRIGSGGAWGEEGAIIFGDAASGLWRVPATGGTPEAVYTPDPRTTQKGTWVGRPELLPGGKAVLFTATHPGAPRIVLLSLETGEERTVVEPGSHARYVSTGHLVYAVESELRAAPFDLETLEVTGVPVPVLQGVATRWGSPRGGADFSVSSSGTLVYAPGSGLEAERKLAWMDRSGAIQSLAAPPRKYTFPSLSPDRRRLAVGITEGSNRDLWVYDLERETLSRLTFGESDTFTLWTPDGERMVFTSARNGQYNLYWKRLDGSGPAERLTISKHAQHGTSFSPDGRVLLFQNIDPATGRDLWLLPLGGEQKPRPFLQTNFDEYEAQFSPDGHWIAYMSDESGRFEIYVRSFPGPGEKLQVSTQGGGQAVWNPDGRELFYLEGRRLMAVSFLASPDVQVGEPNLLFEAETAYIHEQKNRNYDVAPDGQRFLFIIQEEGVASTQLHVVLDWFEELKHLAPVD